VRRRAADVPRRPLPLALRAPRYPACAAPRHRRDRGRRGDGARARAAADRRRPVPPGVDHDAQGRGRVPRRAERRPLPRRGPPPGSRLLMDVREALGVGAGGRVAKHGNRAASSACGSADVLEALGVKIDLGPDGVARCVEEVRVGFMFAPRFHPAMRHAGPVRREIGIRTVFNVLGPLANPAGVRRYLLGVPSVALGATIAAALVELGAERALVVHGTDGLDEISPSADTRTWEVSSGSVREGHLAPEDLGLRRAERIEITGGDPATNATAARAVLDGTHGGARTAVLMNAAAALWVAGLARSVKEGVAIVTRAIDGGAARDALARFAATSQRIGAAEGARA